MSLLPRDMFYRLVQLYHCIVSSKECFGEGHFKRFCVFDLLEVAFVRK